MATFKVRVLYSGGSPVNGSRVVLAFYGGSRGVTDAVYTDSSGYAVFSNQDPGEADVIVDGTTRITRAKMSDGSEHSLRLPG